MSILDKIYKWLDDRFKLSDLLPPIVKHPAPEYAVTNPLYCLGGIAFLCFLILVGTGIFLAMYYKPTPLEAYKSVENIMTAVPMGSLIRSIHHWAANTMIAAVMLHMMRIYFMGAYKKPRELNWVVGVTLLLITTTFGFSGYREFQGGCNMSLIEIEEHEVEEEHHEPVRIRGLPFFPHFLLREVVVMCLITGSLILM